MRGNARLSCRACNRFGPPPLSSRNAHSRCKLFDERRPRIYKAVRVHRTATCIRDRNSQTKLTLSSAGNFFLLALTHSPLYNARAGARPMHRKLCNRPGSTPVANYWKIYRFYITFGINSKNRPHETKKCGKCTTFT